MKSALWIGTGFVAILFMVFTFWNPKNYVRDYFSVIGLPSGHLYKYVKEAHGEPNNIISGNDKKYLVVQYDGIEFVLNNRDNTPSDSDFVDCIRIYSPEIRFGWKKIGVSSTKAEVEKVYKNFQKIKEADCGFIDGCAWIRFYFDENQKVNKIVITMGL